MEGERPIQCIHAEHACPRRAWLVGPLDLDAELGVEVKWADLSRLGQVLRDGRLSGRGRSGSGTVCIRLDHPQCQPYLQLGTGMTTSVSEPNGLLDGALWESPEYDACHS